MKDTKQYSFKITINKKNKTVNLNIGGFSDDKERENFADLLHQTLKYDKLYLIEALQHIEEQIQEELGEVELWYSTTPPTIH